MLYVCDIRVRMCVFPSNAVGAIASELGKGTSPEQLLGIFEKTIRRLHKLDAETETKTEQETHTKKETPTRVQKKEETEKCIETPDSKKRKLSTEMKVDQKKPLFKNLRR